MIPSRTVVAVAVVAAAVVRALVSAQPRAGARDGTPPVAGRGFVGAWRRPPPFGASQSLVTFGADGSVLAVPPLATPLATPAT